MMNKKFKNGFTMLELIFVIIVIGILAATSLSSFKRNVRSDAIANILSSLRYTQHLALTDNKMNPYNAAWQQQLWTLEYSQCNGQFKYSIASDTDNSGTLEAAEAATSVIDGKTIYSDPNNCDSEVYSQEINLGEKYGINNITFAGCGSVRDAISFDYLGRPFVDVDQAVNSDYANLIQNDCTITYSFSSADIPDIVLTINQDTGYVSVNNREGL